MLKQAAVWLVVLLAAIYLLGRFLTRNDRSRPQRFRFAFRRSAVSRLKTACLGDAAKVQRLIWLEKQRNSLLTDEQAAAAALDRLTVDRGRYR